MDEEDSPFDGEPSPNDGSKLENNEQTEEQDLMEEQVEEDPIEDQHEPENQIEDDEDNLKEHLEEENQIADEPENQIEEQLEEENPFKEHLETMVPTEEIVEAENLIEQPEEHPIEEQFVPENPPKRLRKSKVNVSRIRVLQQIQDAKNNTNQPRKNKKKELLRKCIQRAKNNNNNANVLSDSAQLDEVVNQNTRKLSRKFMDEIMYETLWYAAHRHEAQTKDPRRPPRSSVEPNILDVTEGVFNHAMSKLKEAGFYEDHVLNFLRTHGTILPEHLEQPQESNQETQTAAQVGSTIENTIISNEITVDN